jgi:hypothetical protein
MTDEISPMFTEAATYLAGQERDILFRWVQRVSRLPIYLKRPEARLQEVLDHMPRVLQALCQAMLQPVVYDTQPRPSDGAEAHAQERYSQDVPAEIIVKEYQVLRDEIWTTLQEWQRTPSLSIKDIFGLQRRINYSLDEIIATTLAAFVRLEMMHHDPGTGTRSDDPGSG